MTTLPRTRPARRNWHPIGMLGAVILAALVPLQSQGTQEVSKTGWYVDSIHGIRIQIPDKWNHMPRKSNEQWIVATFQSRREYEGTARAGSLVTRMHRPVLRILVFDDAIVEQAKKEKSKVQPYASYAEWVRGTHGERATLLVQGNGKHDGFKVSRYRLEVVSPTRDPKTCVTWVFHRDSIHIAMEYEFLTRHVEKLQKQAFESLGTCKTIERKGGSLAKGPAVASQLTRVEWKKLSVKERFTRRIEETKSRIKRAVASLPRGWAVSETSSFVILSHAPKRLTRSVAVAAECCRQFVEGRYGPISDEYVGRGIIRICKNVDELKVLRPKSRAAFRGADREIIIEGDNSYGTHGRGLGELFYGIFNHYIHAKDELLYKHLPTWIQRGFGSTYRHATIKGRKMVFKARRHRGGHVSRAPARQRCNRSRPGT